MTAIGWLQIALFCAIVVALVKPLGGFMTRVFAGERTFLSPILGPVERGLYRLAGRRCAGRAALDDLRVRDAAVQPRRLHPALRAAAPASRPAAQSARYGRGAAGPRVQHGRQLRHQHELAELRRREHARLPRADGRPHGAELRLGSDGHRARRGARPRLHPPLSLGDRQLLGRSDPDHALRPAADLRRLHAHPRLAGRAAEPCGLRRRGDSRGRDSRPSPKDRSPRRRRSKCSAPTAAAS